MILILLFALLLSVIATVVAILLRWQIKDWRLALLALLMMSLAGSQALTLVSIDKKAPQSTWLVRAPWLQGWPDLVISGMAFLMAIYLASMLRERDRTAEELRSQGELLKQILLHIPHAIFWKDRDLRFLGCNENLAKNLGFNHPDELIGKSDYDLPSTHEQIESYRKMDRNVIETGEMLINHEETVTHADGRIAIVLTSKVPLRDQWNNVIGVLGIFYDVTERNKWDQALKHSEALYHSLVDNLPQCIFRKDLSGRIVFVNQKYCQMHKVSADECIGKTSHDIFPKNLADKFRADDRWITETEGILETVEDHMLPSGECIKVQIVKTPVRNADNRIVGIQGIFWDTTDRTRAEEALRESEEKYRSLVERAHDGICIIQNATIKYTNVQLAGMCGYAPDEVINTCYADYVYHEEVDFVVGKYNTQMSGKESTQHYETAFLHKDGHRIEVDINAGLITYEGQRASLIFVRDITARKHAEQSLHDRDEALAHVTRLTTMGEMVAGIAHEINQPLYAIGNYATACAHTIDSNSTEQTDKLREWMKQIVRQASRAGSILRRLADFAGKSKSQRQYTSLNDLIHESAELVGLDARRYHVNVTYKLARPMSNIHVDSVEIQQVIVNLLRNAYEAIALIDSRPRCIVVHSRVEDGYVVMEVADNGPGLPLDGIDKLFEAFYTTKAEGLGMGLAISRTIIEAHGGKIWAAANDPYGAIFHFSLPTSNGD